MASISERENWEIEAANASGNTPVVFIHGLWLLPSSWANWADFFKQAGYAPLTPDWPDDPESVQEARANPDVLAKKTLKQVADHTTEIINALDKKPAVMGHSTGGLLAQMLAGRPPCSRWRARSWSTRSRAAARSRSRSTSSSTAG
jgi:non-heme chloroperoxidase